MRPAIQTVEDRERLVAAALSWIGTPYAADGAVKGSGCSCVLLPWVALRDFGHVSPQPPARRGLAKVELLPAMRNWLESHPAEFAPIPLDSMDCGDVALLDAGIGHLLLALGRTRLIHCWSAGGVQTISRHDPLLVKRLRAAWRPVVSSL